MITAFRDTPARGRVHAQTGRHREGACDVTFAAPAPCCTFLRIRQNRGHQHHMDAVFWRTCSRSEFRVRAKHSSTDNKSTTETRPRQRSTAWRKRNLQTIRILLEGDVKAFFFHESNRTAQAAFHSIFNYGQSNGPVTWRRG